MSDSEPEFEDEHSTLEIASDASVTSETSTFKKKKKPKKKKKKKKPKRKALSSVEKLADRITDRIEDRIGITISARMALVAGCRKIASENEGEDEGTKQTHAVFGGFHDASSPSHIYFSCD